MSTSPPCTGRWACSRRSARFATSTCPTGRPSTSESTSRTSGTWCARSAIATCRVPASMFDGVSRQLAEHYQFTLVGSHFAIVGRCAILRLTRAIRASARFDHPTVRPSAPNRLRAVRLVCDSFALGRLEQHRGRGRDAGDAHSRTGSSTPRRPQLRVPSPSPASPRACAGPAHSLEDREIPIVGLTAAFVFAAQMLNFPVANGTSGHLLGGVLAAVLVGPWAGALAVAGGARGPGAAVRRRRPVGARPQHREHGAGRRVRRLRHLPALRRSRSARPCVGDRRLRDRRLPRTVVAALVFVVEYASVATARSSVGIGGCRDARCPRPDRHRRGHDHGARRRRGDGHATGPRLRRPAGHQAAGRSPGRAAQEPVRS